MGNGDSVFVGSTELEIPLDRILPDRQPPWILRRGQTMVHARNNTGAYHLSGAAHRVVVGLI